MQRQERSAAMSAMNPDDVVAIAAGTEQCRQHFIDMQDLIKKMGANQADPMTALDRQDWLRKRALKHDPDDAWLGQVKDGAVK